jgi:prephenate dehydrogenase
MFTTSAERGILDTAVVVLRPLEHHDLALESVWILRVREIALAEFVGDHTRLHDRRVE